MLTDEAADRVRDLQRARRASSTPTATATSRSASRAATAGAGSSTPAAARPAAGSCGRCRPRVVEHHRIEVLEGHRAAAILATTAASRSRTADDDRPPAPTILATGGAAALWSRTTNPPGSFGSGLLLARAAGAQLADLEFTQFHPTAVVGLKGREGFLISEAVRGEGATLHGPDGERFVDELAPRDAVARAIFSLLQAPARRPSAST